MTCVGKEREGGFSFNCHWTMQPSIRAFYSTHTKIEDQIDAA